MDKKTQFQIQTSQSKLLKYKKILAELEESKLNIESKSITSSSLDTIKSNNIKELRLLQSNLESQIQLLKLNISKIANNITNKKQELSSLNSILESKNIEEDFIIKEELLRIEAQIIEVKEIHKTNVDNAFLDNLNLFNDIEIIKTELQKQNEVIGQIQTNSHSSRKQTLLELQAKKQNKLITQQTITTINENESEFTNQLLYLESNIIELNEFKKLLIDSNYNDNINNVDNDIDNDTNTKLSYYNNKYNLDTYLYSFTDKINKLDNIIDETKLKLQFINKKYEKNKQSNSFRLKSILDTYNKVNRIKVIGYKDQYKIEKEKRNQLENILLEMTNKYNTFETIILENINANFININNELENDKVRAVNRLSIMKARALEDYNNDNITINCNIDYNKLELETLRFTFDNIKTELNNIKNILEKEDDIESKLESINIEINKYKDIIQQIENDIEKLNAR